MSKQKQNELNNLNVSLHSIISGENMDAVGINIPFADDDEVKISRNGDVSKSSESLSSIESNRQQRAFQRSLSERKRVNLKLMIDRKEQQSDGEDANLAAEKLDKPGTLISDVAKEVPALGLRRNSFSLPVLNDLDLDTLRELHMNAINDDEEEDEEEEEEEIVETPSKIEFESLPEIHVLDDGASPASSRTGAEASRKSEDESESDLEQPMITRSKFRTKRRASIAPLPSIRLNDKEIMVNSEYDAQSVISAAPSITSVSSLASLLREKMQALPSMIRKRKKPKDYKIRIFTVMLFLIIVFLVGYAYVMYNHKVTSKMYFEHIKFSSAKRLLHVSDANGTTVLSGNLGTEIHIPKAYHCRDAVRDESESVCWEWSKVAKLRISLDKKFSGNDAAAKESPTSRCYNFLWESLSENFHPTDCFNIGSERGQWYGGGVTSNAEWLLESNSFDFVPFITGDVRSSLWGNAIKRYFINSLGIAIEVDEATPLHISINAGNSSQLCLKAAYDNFAFVSHSQNQLPSLQYRICTAADMKVLHHNLTQKHLWDGLKEQEIGLVKATIHEPIWEVSDASLSDTSLSNFTDSIIALSYFRLGHVLISEQWQRHVGDFEVDEEHFQSLDGIIDVLHRRGFRISLTIQPFVSTESKTFAELVRKRLLIYERQTDRTIPALTKFKGSRSDGMLDATNNATLPWLLSKLEAVQKKYKIDSFYLELGSAFDMPKFYESDRPLLNPDQYKTIFVRGVKNSINVLGVSNAIAVPSPPAFLSLPLVNSTWHGLRTTLTSVISYGIIGYPFVMLGAIGGDFIVTESAVSTGDLPERELFIRWLQLATFLPVMRFKYLPSDYKDDNLTEIAKELAIIRQKTVNGIFDKFVNVAMDEGLPLIRPLWMLDPHDAACVSVIDEFSIGDQIIVAPILEKGVTVREVYLPQGVWKDGIDGSLRKGSRWIHHYRVLEHQVAYFVKMPDNTRF